MPLNNMTIKPPIIEHATLQVYPPAGCQLSKVGLLKGFLHSSNPVRRVFRFRNGKAYAIVRYTLIHLQLPADIAFYNEMPVCSFRLSSENFSHRFDDTRKHDSN